MYRDINFVEGIALNNKIETEVQNTFTEYLTLFNLYSRNLWERVAIISLLFFKEIV